MLKLINAFTENRFYVVYLTGLMLFAVGLPLSKTAMSLALFLLAIHWLVSAGFRQFPSAASARGAAFWVFMLIVFIHLAGLIHTTDFRYAFKDLRIKLPLLLLPLFTITGPALSKKHLYAILKVFIITVVAGSLISLYIHLVKKPVDARDLTPFVSHIRFSMMVCFSIFASLIIAFRKDQLKSIRWGAIVVAAWLTIFLIMLESLTGVLTFMLILFAIPVYSFFRYRKTTVKVISLLLFILFSGLTWFIVHQAKSEFHPHVKFAADKLHKHTPLGNPYFHDTASLVNENGNFIWLYVSEEEMMNAWNERSQIHFDSMLAPDSKTGDVLMRYLSSKGLKKDADGVNALSDDDVQAIERGITNYRYDQWSGMKRRLDQLKWEYWNYLEGGDPLGHSLLQRFELWKAGWSLAGENLLFGAGTGDVKIKFAEKLQEMGSSLAGTSLRAHNQYLTILVTFGITGFVLFLTALLIPLIINRRRIGFAGMVFLVIVFISMFIEDTLETQVGVSFFIFFYSLMIFQDVLCHSGNNKPESFVDNQEAIEN